MDLNVHQTKTADRLHTTPKINTTRLDHISKTGSSTNRVAAPDILTTMRGERLTSQLLYPEKWETISNAQEWVGPKLVWGEGKNALAQSYWPTTVMVNLLDFSIYQISYTSCFFIDTTGIIVLKFLIIQLSSEIRWEDDPALKFSCLGHYSKSVSNFSYMMNIYGQRSIIYLPKQERRQ